MIPYGKQWLDNDDIQAVIDVLKSDYLTQGPQITEFEKSICEYTGAKYAVAVSNATAGLHIAVQALNIDGFEGITSSITFTASSNSMIYCKVKPVFAEIDANTYNITANTIKDKLTDKTRLLTPVHFAGQPCDMVAIKSLADENKLYVIEDAAHAIGSDYSDGSKVGNCKYSDMTVFSFHPVKTITAGEGGVITTNSKELYDKLLLLRSHGITKDPDVLEKNEGPWYYEMQSLGYNYRMTDIQAALGNNQLKKLDSFKARRKEIVSQYNNEFSNISWLKVPTELEGLDSCFHLYVLQFDFDKIGKTRTEVMNELRSKNVLTQVHYIPVHTQPYYRDSFGYKIGDYPVAEDYYEHALSIPLYPKMSEEDVKVVISGVLGLKNE